VSFTSSTGADTANTIALTNFANAMVTLHYSGTVTGGQMFFEVSDDNSNWYGITMAATDSATPPADNYTLSSAAGNITWQMFVGGYSFFRVRMHIQVVGSGTAIVAITPSTLPAEPAIEITGALPAGSNVIGHVVVDSGTLTTVSTVSAVTAISNALPAGTNTIGTVKVTGNAGGAFDAATGAAVPANALYEGLIATTSYPTAASSGNIVGMMGDKAGRPAVVLNTVRDLVGTAVVSNNSTASGVSFIGAGAAGVFNDIITFIATNRSSSATVVTLTDGTASYTFALAGNGGIVINFPTPLPATSSATAWTIGNSATVACDYIAVYAKNK
jgi:hypothetical protein